MRRKELKDYWFIISIVVLLIIGFPIFLNFILQLTFRNVKIIGDENLWLSFWSSYSGSVIVGLITLFVLFKTLRQNQDNYIEQIDFQVRTIKCQVKQEWFNNLKNVTINNLSKLDFGNIEGLIGLIQVQSSNWNLIKEINSFEEKIKGIKTEITIIYNNEFTNLQQIMYVDILGKHIDENLKILSSFKEYMVKWESDVIERLAQINDFKGNANSEATLKLAKARLDILNKGTNKKKEIQNIIESFKNRILVSRNQFERNSIDLIKFEGERVFQEINESTIKHTQSQL